MQLQNESLSRKRSIEKRLFLHFQVDVHHDPERLYQNETET